MYFIWKLCCQWALTGKNEANAFLCVQIKRRHAPPFPFQGWNLSRTRANPVWRIHTHWAHRYTNSPLPPSYYAKYQSSDAAGARHIQWAVLSKIQFGWRVVPEKSRVTPKLAHTSQRDSLILWCSKSTPYPASLLCGAGMMREREHVCSPSIGPSHTLSSSPHTLARAAGGV